MMVVFIPDNTWADLLAGYQTLTESRRCTASPTTLTNVGLPSPQRQRVQRRVHRERRRMIIRFAHAAVVGALLVFPACSKESQDAGESRRRERRH